MSKSSKTTGKVQFVSDEQVPPAPKTVTDNPTPPVPPAEPPAVDQADQPGTNIEPTVDQDIEISDEEIHMNILKDLERKIPELEAEGEKLVNKYWQEIDAYNQLCDEYGAEGDYPKDIADRKPKRSPREKEIADEINGSRIMINYLKDLYHKLPENLQSFNEMEAGKKKFIVLSSVLAMPVFDRMQLHVMYFDTCAITAETDEHKIPYYKLIRRRDAKQEIEKWHKKTGLGPIVSDHSGRPIHTLED